MATGRLELQTMGMWSVPVDMSCCGCAVGCGVYVSGVGGLMSCMCAIQSCLFFGLGAALRLFFSGGLSCGSACWAVVRGMGASLFMTGCPLSWKSGMVSVWCCVYGSGVGGLMSCMCAIQSCLTFGLGAALRLFFSGGLSYQCLIKVEPASNPTNVWAESNFGWTSLKL